MNRESIKETNYSSDNIHSWELIIHSLDGLSLRIFTNNNTTHIVKDPVLIKMFFDILREFTSNDTSSTLNSIIKAITADDSAK